MMMREVSEWQGAVSGGEESWTALVSWWPGSTLRALTTLPLEPGHWTGAGEEWRNCRSEEWVVSEPLVGRHSSGRQQSWTDKTREDIVNKTLLYNPFYSFGGIIKPYFVDNIKYWFDWESEDWLINLIILAGQVEDQVR